jgi:hypothetical protein
MMLNMAILVYLENQNVFLPRGIRAQIGYMGNWMELVKERQPDSKSKTIPKRIGSFAGDAPKTYEYQDMTKLVRNTTIVPEHDANVL